MRRVVFVLLAAMLPVGFLHPCTIFSVEHDGRTLVGNNEDWEDYPTRVWFLPRSEVAHGRVLFGFINGWAQGGMNDQGLFFDWVSGYETGWTRSPDLPDYFENISEKILEEASTVDEALALCSSFNFGAFAAARMMLVDRSGASAVIGYEDGELRIWRSEDHVLTVGARAERAGQMLRSGADVDVTRVAEILSACRLGGRYQTRYSNVYDLEERVVYISEGTDSEETVALELEAELKMGSHYYDLSHLSEQRSQPPKVDHKTAPAVEIPQSAVTAVSGTYRGSTDTLRAVRIGEVDGQMYLWPVAGQAQRFRLYPVSEGVFVVRCTVGSLSVRRGPDGKIEGLLLEQAGVEHMLDRLPVQ